MYRGFSSAGMVIYFMIFSEYGVGPGWWLEDSRVVKVVGLVSSRVSKGDPVLDCIWFLSCRRLPFFLWRVCLLLPFDLAHSHFCRLSEGCHHFDLWFLVFHLDSFGFHDPLVLVIRYKDHSTFLPILPYVFGWQ